MNLPHVSGKKTIDTLIRAGFMVQRTKGSHYILKNLETGKRVTVPYHSHELAPKTLQSIIRQADISIEEFVNLL